MSDSTGDSLNTDTMDGRYRRGRLLLTGAVVVVYAALAIALGGLTFEPTRDETHFWPTSQQFAEAFPPSLEQLRGYNELNTPLPFVIFGAAEWMFGGGIAAGRWINCLLSLGITLLIVWTARPPVWRMAIAAAGLLVFPYFLGSSVMLYTDIIAAAFVLVGMVLHGAGRPWIGAAAFALAIASRQYAVAFPIAVAAHELFRPMPNVWKLLRPRAAWIAPALAAATLGGWFAFFGGPAPPAAIDDQRLSTAPLLGLHAAHSLYFLTSIGAYFVVIEALLVRGLHPLIDSWQRPLTWALAGGVIVGFVLVPPLRNVDYPIPTMGYLDKVARLILNDPLRMGAFGMLALLTVARFSRVNLAFWLVWVNALLMMKAHIGWDKYALPLLVVLWWMTAYGGIGRATPDMMASDTRT